MYTLPAKNYRCCGMRTLTKTTKTRESGVSHLACGA